MAAETTSQARQAWTFMTDDELRARRLRKSFSSLAEVHRFHNHLVTGRADQHFLAYFRARWLGSAPVDAVSLGSGDGHLERTFLQEGWAFRSLVGLELNPVLVRHARERIAALPGGGAVRYQECDLDRLHLERESLDLAVFFHSLHHVRALEGCLGAVARALRPGGKVLVVDYFGGNRLQRPPLQLAMCDALLARLPPRYRVDLSRSSPAEPVLKERCENADPAAVARADPSEAVRSEDIARVLHRERRLVTLEERPLGGTLLEPLLEDIAGNFADGDEVGLAYLQGALSAEEALLRSGFPSDYRFVVLERRRPWLRRSPRPEAAATTVARASAYLERLRTVPGKIGEELRDHPERLAGALHERYPFFPREVIDEVIAPFRRPPLRDSALAMRYLDSEFATFDAQAELVELLERRRLSVRGRAVLDVGCSNGALLHACLEHGAARAVGVDVDEGRLARARRLLGALPASGQVEVLRADILEQDLPAGLRPFEVILSTNVLEHVPSVPRLFEGVRRHLARTPGAYGLLSVANKYHLGNVLSEPHYGVPGMVLLPRAQAKAIFDAERGRLGLDQAYEVFDWYLGEEYLALARAAGLEAELLLDDEALAALDAQAVDAEPLARRSREEALERLRTLALSVGSEALLRRALDAYFEERARDHQALRRAPSQARAVFVKYHSFLLRVVLRHPGDGHDVVGTPGSALEP